MSRPLPYSRPSLNAPVPDRVPRPTWIRALLSMVVVAAVLWAVQIANAAEGYEFDEYGLKPRHLDGLWGVMTMPFLHASYPHLLSNTVPVIALGWVVLLSGVRIWTLVTVSIILLGGLLTWLVAPGDSIVVGASGLVFGWLGYLLARAFFSRRLKWILVAAVVLVFFGSLLAGLLPQLTSDVSWQAHVCGFAAGVAVGAALHPRGTGSRIPRGPVVS